MSNKSEKIKSSGRSGSGFNPSPITQTKPPNTPSKAENLELTLSTAGADSKSLEVILSSDLNKGMAKHRACGANTQVSFPSCTLQHKDVIKCFMETKTTVYLFVNH